MSRNESNQDGNSSESSGESEGGHHKRRKKKRDTPGDPFSDLFRTLAAATPPIPRSALEHITEKQRELLKDTEAFRSLMASLDVPKLDLSNLSPAATGAFFADKWDAAELADTPEEREVDRAHIAAEAKEALGFSDGSDDEVLEQVSESVSAYRSLDPETQKALADMAHQVETIRLTLWSYTTWQEAAAEEAKTFNRRMANVAYVSLAVTAIGAILGIVSVVAML